MDQIFDFFINLFSTSDWPPRWFCGTWSEFHGWLYIFSDVAIWLAYFIIPVIIIWFIQYKPNIQFLPVFWLFGAFIICCGTTHLMDAVLFWWPAYRLSALLRLITAIVSFITVFALIRDLPKIMNLKIPKSAAEQIADLREILNERELENEALQERLGQLESDR